MAGNIKITDRIKPFTKKVIRAVDNNLTAASWYFVGDIMRGLGRGSAPGVETGRMLGSITQIMVRPLEHWVGSTIQPRAGQKFSYPYYQEFGFTHWKSKTVVRHPWLRPSFDRSKMIMLKIIGRKATA